MLGMGCISRFSVAVMVALVALLTARGAATEDPALNAMKARLSSTGIGDRPHLCVQIAEHQLAETDKLYAAAEMEKAQVPDLTSGRTA